MHFNIKSLVNRIKANTIISWVGKTLRLLITAEHDFRQYLSLTVPIRSLHFVWSTLVFFTGQVYRGLFCLVSKVGEKNRRNDAAKWPKMTNDTNKWEKREKKGMQKPQQAAKVMHNSSRFILEGGEKSRDQTQPRYFQETGDLKIFLTRHPAVK